MTRKLAPSDIRRRAARKIERTALAEQGLLERKPNTFTYFANRLGPKRSIFESPNAQQDLNTAICMYPFDVAAMEHTRGRLSVMTHGADDLAAYLVSKGWVAL